MKRFYFILFTLIICNSILAQDVQFQSTNKSTLIGIGGSNVYDTYLSPLQYKGTSFHLLNEQMKQTSLFDGKFIKQQITNLEIALAKSPAQNSQEYWLSLDYSLGGHYKLVKTSNFRFLAGGLWNTSLGLLYNGRNSNNIASAKAYSNINLSAIAFYNFKSLTFRWQMDVPVMGILFSPNFGQSYYEMSLGNTVGTINFASLHNQRALRNYFTMDVPINNLTLRVGYLGSYYQTKVHDLQTHTYSSSFMLGLVSESINLGGKRMKNKAIKSSYY